MSTGSDQKPSPKHLADLMALVVHVRSQDPPPISPSQRHERDDQVWSGLWVLCFVSILVGAWALIWWGRP